MDVHMQAIPELCRFNPPRHIDGQGKPVNGSASATSDAARFSIRPDIDGQGKRSSIEILSID